MEGTPIAGWFIKEIPSINVCFTGTPISGNLKNDYEPLKYLSMYNIYIHSLLETTHVHSNVSSQFILSIIVIWLVASNFLNCPFHIWDVIFPIDELIFFNMVKTTNQVTIIITIVIIIDNYYHYFS